MCTAITYKTDNHYFGRTLDVDRLYGEKVCITPRRFPLPFRRTHTLHSHYALIGMALVADGYPLYFDAVNEKGLAMAGLNFPGYAHYRKEESGRDNVAPFEFIPWILGQCGSVAQARALCGRTNLMQMDFSDALPAAPLHWIISDREESITVEAVEAGIFIYRNAAGVLTNNPPYPMQLFNLNNYRNLSAATPENTFAEELMLDVYCQGMGGLGLPGDLTSESRFVRAAFTKMNAAKEAGEEESVGQFFHILGTVEQTRGCSLVSPGVYETTEYTACMNTDRGIYYYTTYGNRQITGVDLHKENLDGAELKTYTLIREQQIRRQNSRYEKKKTGGADSPNKAGGTNRAQDAEQIRRPDRPRETAAEKEQSYVQRDETKGAAAAAGGLRGGAAARDVGRAGDGGGGRLSLRGAAQLCVRRFQDLFSWGEARPQAGQPRPLR